MPGGPASLGDTCLCHILHRSPNLFPPGPNTSSSRTFSASTCREETGTHSLRAQLTARLSFFPCRAFPRENVSFLREPRGGILKQYLHR